MIVINFKNYAFGKKGLKLAKKIGKYLPDAYVAVPATDIKSVVSKTDLKVLAEHVDYFEKGGTTGFVIPEDVKASGAIGTLLNHSEHRLREETIKKTMKRLEEVDLKTILCVESVKEAKKYKKLKPWAMAFEDPELIGTGRSITDYKADEVKNFVKELKRTKIIPLCGAGINKVEDFIVSRDLGCRGVLIASAIVNVSLMDAGYLLRGLRDFR